MSGTAFNAGQMAEARRGQVSLAISTHHDPSAFYQTREGLYVWGDFTDGVVSKAKPTKMGTIFKINFDELGTNLTDAKIESGLPKRHLFDERALCAIIADMIAQQPEGKEGDLLANGRVNLFYTHSWIVCVHWFSGYRKWHVYAWGRDGRRWNGGRVFSPAN